jgi:dihydroflavonol-4-reductase
VKALVTGATGFIGYHVARYLAEKGIETAALVREGSRADALRAIGVKDIRGDVRDRSSIVKALKNCDTLFHLAADYRLWTPDPDSMFEINVQGTINVMSAAMETGIDRVIYTSSVGALAASREGSPSNEETPVQLSDMIGPYKTSKFLAEREVYGFIDRGLPATIVSPSTPIGAMDTRPTPTGKIIVDFLNGKMPAYLDTGMNFVDVEDVASGHWLACLHGRTGEKYILGNRNMTLRDFLGIIAGIVEKKPPSLRLPYISVLAAAYVNELFSRITKKPPVIPLTGVKMAGKYMYFDCSKAIRELKLPQNPIEAAVRRAISWFSDNGYVMDQETAR